MPQLNNAQRSIAIGAAVAVLFAQFMTVEQKGAERAAWTLAILVVAVLLIVACATPTEEPIGPTLRSEPERRPIGFIQPA
jgi:protein-S-isoprenylcysteine O-methyltransferase Ste14